LLLAAFLFRRLCRNAQRAQAHGGRVPRIPPGLADPVIGAERASQLQRRIAGLDQDHDIHVLMAA
jgi:hypothetical protein